MLFAIPFEGLEKGEMYALSYLFGIIRIRPVAYGIVLVDIHMINTAVIRCHRSDHAIELLLLVLLL